MRYFVEIAYDGSKYHGWQIQPNGNTVQAELDRALSVICAEQIQSLGCGRTDTGVHATQFYAHFDCQRELHEANLQNINALLPRDIAAKSLHHVDPGAHARFDASERGYQYFMHFEKDPFLEQRSFQFNSRFGLDLPAMNRCAALLLLEEDFASFCKSNSGSSTTICKLMLAEWSELPNGQLRFDIRADRFLRNMVRAIVGTLLDVGLGKISQDEFVHIIKQKNRSFAGTSVPPQGLYLTEVRYPFISR
jgi:tRNA pseudouridine38-40 synthase